MKNSQRYLLVKGEPFLTACRGWQAGYVAAIKAINAFVRTHGGNQSVTGREKRLLGIWTADGKPPEGWKKSGKGRYQMFVPRKDAKEIISAMRALPTAPSMDEVNNLVGCPCQVRWTDGTSSGFEGLGFMQGVQLMWPAGGEPFVLSVPDARPVIEDIKRRQPNTVITHGADWKVPSGLEEITEAEWTLIKAQAAVEAERKAA